MMSILNETQIWEKIYPLWLQKATEHYILYVLDQNQWEEALQRFYRALQQAVRLGDLAPIQQVAKDWMENGTPFWRYERTLVVTPLVSTLVQLLTHLFLEHVPQHRRPEMLPWWKQALALVVWTAETELQIRFHDLEEQRRHLARMEQLKSGFVVVVGHELRTPLTVVDGYLQMLNNLAEQDAVIPSHELRHIAAGMQRGIHRLRELIDAVLDLVYVESGQVAQHPQPIWLHRLVYRVVEEHLPMAQQRRITLKMEPEPPPKALIMGDPEYLTKALHHLLDNALKFTPDGGRVTVRMLVDTPSNQVEIQVQDTGIGIPPEAQQHIFDRFVRLGDPDTYSSSRQQFKGGGTGLGLAIVKGVVQAHGGHVWVESEGYDEQRFPGATFYVRLPLASEHEALASPLSRPKPVSQSP